MKNTYSKFYELFFKKNPNLTVILYSNLSKIVLVFIFSIHIGGYTGWTQNYLWAEKIGGSNSDNVTSIDLDSFKNIYTTGLFAGTVDFDPGPSTFNLSTLNNEVSNPFVSKLDASGNFIWAKQFKAAGAGTGGNSTLLKLINRIMFILLVNLLILLILIQELGYLTSLQMEREIFLFANLMNLVILFGLKV